MGIVEEAHNVKVLGSGDGVIILVPHLVEDFRVVLCDNMGVGTTNPEYFDFNRYPALEGYAYDLLGILEELQVDSCILVGHSVSAMVRAIASISRPDLFSKIIMISASPRYLNDVDYYGGFEQKAWTNSSKQWEPTTKPGVLDSHH